ncbi:MAG TPA: tRNA (adenosine(37)-N6)-threonylcarbamoyltransferase complex ATPase subunit type 1 TsaE [Armatimonadota bacterium]|jgi:tRNA threonylcarbamoyladenosine biosynthesis protein TsaE
MTIANPQQGVVYHLPTPEATRALGAAVAACLRPGDVLLLDGELGAGKTTFTQGLAHGLAIPDDVLSPTFALMSEYRAGRVQLLHVDAYRLNGAADAEQLGLHEYLDRGWALVVEWAGNIRGALPVDSLEIHFEYDGDARRATFRAQGGASRRLMEECHAAGIGD